VTLDFLVVGASKKMYQRLEETSIDDGRLVHGVNGDVADTGDSGEDERKEGGLEEAEKRTKTTVAHNLELVLLIRGEVAQSKSGLALDFWSMAIHEVD
jgi:hypothetical protein